MANNKIVYGNTTLVDLTGDTATIDKVAQGITFFDASGTQRTGTMTLGGASVSGTNLSIPGKTYTPPSWSTGKAEDIATALEYHYKGRLNLQDYWHVGDKRTARLSAMSGITNVETHLAQDVEYVLSHIGGKTLSNGVTCAFQVDQVNSLNVGGIMNNSSANSWKNSERRTWCNSTYKNSIPSTLRDIFKEFINQTSAGSKSTTIENTTDTFALRAEIEVFGSTTYSVSGEGSQVKWYETSANRIKTLNGRNEWWQLRSPHGGTNTEFCRTSSLGAASYGVYSIIEGVPPFGVI